MKRVKILDIPFVNVQKQEMVEVLNEKIKKQERCFIVTANPEIVMYADRNKSYKNVVLSSDYVIPDGIGIIIASKLMQNPLTERVAGFDLMMALFHKLNETHGKKVFLLGAEDAVVKKAATNIHNMFPNIEIVGYHHGYFELDDQAIVQQVKDADPDLILVALGFPRQEFWIANNLHKFKKGIFVGVGGSFDVLAGKVKRAPVFWQKLNLEWFYRLIKQPSRWKRMLVLPEFLIGILRLKFKK